MVIVERGNCTFVQKTHYAQVAGFKVIYVVDSEQRSVDSTEMMPDRSGLGLKLHIATLLIPKNIGIQFINYL